MLFEPNKDNTTYIGNLISIAIKFPDPIKVKSTLNNLINI